MPEANDQNVNPVDQDLIIVDEVDLDVQAIEERVAAGWTGGGH